MEKHQPRILVVFDFDHTLVKGNTDTWITKLCNSSKKVISDRDSKSCWTDVMQNVFTTLQKENFSRKDYEDCFKSLHFIDGMKETCDYIYEKGISCIIISDSNTYFIDHLLNRDRLKNVFCKVYSNPGEWKDNGLHIKRYHSHACDMCPENLCKKEVLLKFKVEHESSNNVIFDHIFYIGDGGNDLCPSLSLTHNDYVLPREGYRLLELLNKRLSVDANIIPWSTGYQVLEAIRNVVEKNSA